MKYLAMVAMALVLTGCASRFDISKFTPLSDSEDSITYEYRVNGKVEEDDKAESKRIHWLNKWVSDVGGNPKTMEIIERKEIVTNVRDGYKQVFYTVKVKK